MSLNELLSTLVAQEGSDLHLLDGNPAKIRVHGELEKVGEIINDVNGLVFPILDQLRQDDFKNNGEADCAYELKNIARFRVNIFLHHNGTGAVFRIIPDQIPTLEELGMPKDIEKLAKFKNGLVLITGPTGSGKSSTLASILEIINNEKNLHILTIEDPIEFVHYDNQSIFTQREVGIDTDSFVTSLNTAAHQDVDLVLVGEMRDKETIEMALRLAEMGMLVFSTLHTNSAAHTVDRIVEVFPKERQPQMRTILASSIQGILSQVLCRRIDGKGRVPATELLFSSRALSSVIQEGASHKIESLIQTGKNEGMHTMDDSLLKLANDRMIEGEEAYLKGNNKALFQRFVK